ncbi:hypothetical protein IU459_01945 [Nocardia amamiensis]|uniref:DUF3806 domain-containing protein n=1 Tax=Nocardia amamiensis TaxID=404578 RepID=A0ABS0CI59_9NOCA|nr:hypothetical protein [Nocardia amamiensis]MBF6296303.1 hypothetical protein [Nocardia amamiensis]
MDSKEISIAEWERGRREALRGLLDALGVDDIDLETDPVAFLSILDEFVAAQDYSNMDEGDWIWLHTILAAYVAQVFIVEYRAKWDLITDERGPNYVLLVAGRDGVERAISPMDIVYEDLRRYSPPELARILAVAEEVGGL